MIIIFLPMNFHFSIQVSLPSLHKYAERSGFRIIFLNPLKHHIAGPCKLMLVCQSWPHLLSPSLYISELLEAVQFSLKCFLCIHLRIYSQVTILWKNAVGSKLIDFTGGLVFYFVMVIVSIMNFSPVKTKGGTSREESSTRYINMFVFCKGFFKFYLKGLCSSFLQTKLVNLYNMPISAQCLFNMALYLHPMHCIQNFKLKVEYCI